MTIITVQQISSKGSAIKCRMFINVPAAPFLSVPPFPIPCKLTSDPAVYYAHLAGNRARVNDPSRDREDDSSSGSGGLARAMGGLALDVTVPALKPLHANVQESMWWM